MTTSLEPSAPPVTLDNCDREPIHVPGRIQPHGILLAFDGEARLTAWSANAGDLLGRAPQGGEAAGGLGLDREVLHILQGCIRQAERDTSPPAVTETVIDGQTYDAVVHGHLGRFLLELERRDQASDEVAAFALQAYRSIDRLKHQRSLSTLLEMAVEEMRALTGFDRVMAYCFRPDDSGEVVAESCGGALEPLLGLCYPASDIPAQARHLYTLNTLRLIADAGYQPVPVVGLPGAAPLDMSHAVLRSVSPIHLEYLRNMHVEASMSLSIVVQDRLWGLLACHHASPRRVPYSIRIACDVLTQMLASTVQNLEARERAERSREGAEARAALLETLLHEEDVLSGLFAHAEALKKTLGADALLLVQAGRVVRSGDLPEDLAAGIARSLPGDGDDLVLRQGMADWPPDLRPRLGVWAGLLGLRFDPTNGGWLLALRTEQVVTVRWAGRPEKEVRQGPYGPYLRPRTSFAEWRETVRGLAEPWDEAHLDGARALLVALHRASHLRHAETERARTLMLAILGHDLRDPLQSIGMAAEVLEADGHQPALGQRIRSSTDRMQRLVGQMLDLGRLHSGLGLDIRRRPCDLTLLLEDLIDEAGRAYPEATYKADLAPGLVAEVDPDRIAQAVTNLLGNARHHGTPRRPIRVRLCRVRDQVVLTVRNVAPPIDEATAAHLFSPFKKSLLSREAGRRRGLGLGLYIAYEIVVMGHGGRLSYRAEAPDVVFTVELPGVAGRQDR
jgi:chemotaxis family two-component system sensor kinase Cph1